MNTSQVNFAKLPLALKEQVEEIGAEYSTKQELLSALVTGYKEAISNKENLELDVSHYKAIDKKSKDDTQHLFSHFLSVLDGNFLSIKTEALALAKQKKEIEYTLTAMVQSHADVEKVLEEEIVELEAEKENEIILLVAENKDKVKTLVAENKKIESENKKLLNEIKRLRTEKEEVLKNLHLSRKLIKVGEEQDLKIITLNTTLSKKESAMGDLEKELSKKDRKLDRIEDRVENLEKDTEEYRAESSLSSKTIRTQEIEIAVLKKELEMIKKHKN